MKTRKLSTLFTLAVLPASVFADSATERKIKEAATNSYSYRTVGEDHVKVSAKNGGVTLNGTAQHSGANALAADSAENAPTRHSPSVDAMI